MSCPLRLERHGSVYPQRHLQVSGLGDLGGRPPLKVELGPSRYPSSKVSRASLAMIFSSVSVRVVRVLAKRSEGCISRLSRSVRTALWMTPRISSEPSLRASAESIPSPWIAFGRQIGRAH